MEAIYEIRGDYIYRTDTGECVFYIYGGFVFPMPGTENT
jgi:hypothetical protein